MAFNADDRLLAVVVNGIQNEGNKVLIYKWTTPTSTGKASKLICQCELPRSQEVARVTFHPTDRQMIILSGTSILRQFVIQEDQLVPSELEYSGFPDRKHAADFAFTDHTFTPEGNILLACTKGGQIFSFNLFDLSHAMHQPDAKYTCIVAFRGNNFCAGTEDGQLHFYKFDAASKQFDLVKIWGNTCVELNRQKVIGLAAHEASKDEIFLAAVGKSQNIVYINVHKQIFARPKGALDVPQSMMNNIMSPTSSQANQGQPMDDDFAAALLSQERIQYETLGRGFHQGGISHLDISLQRPILATFSRDDCTIRIWNYLTG